MGRQVAVVLLVLVLVAVVVGVDVLFFRNHFWERLMVNVGIVLVFAAFSSRFRRADQPSRRNGLTRGDRLSPGQRPRDANPDADARSCAGHTSPPHAHAEERAFDRAGRGLSSAARLRRASWSLPATS
jgi:hypothetical protein